MTRGTSKLHVMPILQRGTPSACCSQAAVPLIRPLSIISLLCESYLHRYCLIEYCLLGFCRYS
jgi:hypothetical protein